MLCRGSLLRSPGQRAQLELLGQEGEQQRVVRHLMQSLIQVIQY